MDTLQGAGYSQSRHSHEAPWQISSCCCASAHQGMPPCGKQESHEPLRHEPFLWSHHCLGALQRAPYRRSQDALQPAKEAHPEPLCWGALDMQSRDPCKAPQPMRSSALDALQGALLQQPLGEAPEEPFWVMGVT